MKHCVSLKYGHPYARVLNTVAEENESVEAREFTKERDDNGETYMLLTLYTWGQVSRETEREVDKLSEVIVSTFNIEED